jgi:hypothetical protein
MPSAKEFRDRAWRLVLCLATAVVISATAYLCAWTTYRNNVYPLSPPYLTRVDLALLREEMEGRKAEGGGPPARLSDLDVVKEKRVLTDNTGEPVDRWGRAFQYRVLPGGYVLYSHGRDGKPGGVGPDADLYAGADDSWAARPTLLQFTASPEALPMQLACLFAGVVAFPLCLLQARGEPGNRRSLGKVLLMNAVTAVFAILAALMIGALHMVPGGH